MAPWLYPISLCRISPVEQRTLRRLTTLGRMHATMKWFRPSKEHLSCLISLVMTIDFHLRRGTVLLDSLSRHRRGLPVASQ
jgi:hypothetical protein